MYMSIDTYIYICIHMYICTLYTIHISSLNPKSLIIIGYLDPSGKYLVLMALWALVKRLWAMIVGSFMAQVPVRCSPDLRIAQQF